MDDNYGYDRENSLEEGEGLKGLDDFALDFRGRMKDLGPVGSSGGLGGVAACA